MKRGRNFSRKTIVEGIGIRLQVWSRTFVIISAGLAAMLSIGLISPSNSLAGCAGPSGNYAILMQGSTAPTPSSKPVVGVGAIQLNSATCSVTGELIYNAGGSFLAYPNNQPQFTGTSAQLSGTYSMQNLYNGTLTFADNGTCAGCSHSGTAFTFAITAHGAEIRGSGSAGGPVLTLTAEKQAVFSPTQLVGTFPFSCNAISMGNFFPPGDAYSFTGVTVYPAGSYLPFPSAFSCVDGPPADDVGITLSGLCDSTFGCPGNGAPFAPLSSQSPPNASDATVNLSDLTDCMDLAGAIPGMSTVLWGSANQYHWSVGTNIELASGTGISHGSAEVETCSGGPGGAAGTVTILPTSVSLVTSPTNPLKQIATKTVKITNNTARMVIYGASSPISGPPPVAITNDTCITLVTTGSPDGGGIQPYSSCSFNVVCTNTGGSTLTPVTVSVPLDQQATNDSSNTVLVNCTH